MRMPASLLNATDFCGGSPGKAGALGVLHSEGRTRKIGAIKIIDPLQTETVPKRTLPNKSLVTFLNWLYKLLGAFYLAFQGLTRVFFLVSLLHT